MKKIALVTGGSKGIGAAIALSLADAGFDIWLNYRSDFAAAQQVQQQIEKLGSSCCLLPFDVADLEQVEGALKPLLEDDTPFVLVNNAGFARDSILAMMSSDDWNDVMSVHLGGFFNVTHTLLPFMMRKRKGRIVNIVSTSGQIGVAGQTNYSAAKAGLIGATRSLAAEVAKRKILVNAVAPGFIATEMIEELPMEQILPMIPLGRVGTVEEVASMVEFLCSDKSSYITGQVFSVNGGACMP
ncbi:MAG: 3-oxoacyl-ACP reductase [Desulfobacteraceae bacterium 4572_35.1]|nr:MAG: 3-oxoacyl-ACP reductase [Desulfobacteraceae bacterium 4572_35.1]